MNDETAEPTVDPRHGRKEQPAGRFEVMAEAAERGDVQAVMAALRGSAFFPSGEDCRMAQPYIQAALENAARDGSKKLVEALFNAMLVFNGRLMYRVQHEVEVETHLHDRRQPNHGDLPDRVTKELLPRLHRIQEAILGTSRGMSSVLHTLDLVDKERHQYVVAHREGGGRVVRLTPVVPEIDRVARNA